MERQGVETLPNGAILPAGVKNGSANEV
jgi:hypothetical protein